jgi:proteasome endopeptidase complex, beta component (EC 3.4.25.1). Threonine peptidase. MEROPS family T01A
MSSFERGVFVVEIKTGTTTLAITCKEAVVMATDKRATAGTMIAHKNVQKLQQIGDRIAMTMAGLAADGQVLGRWLKSEIALYNIRNNTEMSVNGAATFISNVLNQYKFTPFYVQLLIAGYDGKGPHAFDLDAAGGLFEDKYISTGSGSPYVYGLLENSYKKDMSLEETLKLAKQCVKVAMSRDSASGDDIEIVYIDKESFKRLSKEEMDKL